MENLKQGIQEDDDRSWVTMATWQRNTPGFHRRKRTSGLLTVNMGVASSPQAKNSRKITTTA